MRKTLLNKIKKIPIIVSIILSPFLFSRCEEIEDYFKEKIGETTKDRPDAPNFFKDAVMWENLPDTSIIETYLSPGQYYFWAKEIPLGTPLKTKKDTIDFWAKFDKTCVYDTLEPLITNYRNQIIYQTNSLGDTIKQDTIQIADTFKCEGDWNKLFKIYINDDPFEASLNEHNEGFCWRTLTHPETKQRTLQIGHYTHNKGHPDARDGKVIKNYWMEWIEPDKWHHFKLIDNKIDYEYWFQEELKRIDPHKYSDTLKFLGGPYHGGNCGNQTQDTMRIYFSKTNPKNLNP